MGLRDRFRRAPSTAPVRVRGLDRAVAAHLEEFARSRRGVEGYVEPATTVTEMTVVLVASDGEWTRRRVPDARAVAELGQRLGIPVYDVHATGYPTRMREWTSRQKKPGAGGAG